MNTAGRPVEMTPERERRGRLQIAAMSFRFRWGIPIPDRRLKHTPHRDFDGSQITRLTSDSEIQERKP